MKRVKDALRNDIWVVILDIFAVNFAYWLALLLRLAIQKVANPGGDLDKFVSAFYRFAPWYTVLCLIVFFAFRLYGGMWRYAGINDMNRILGASLVTCILQVAGTMLFVRRMPISYYGLGAVFQFLLVTLIRFGHRILLVEGKKLASRSTPAMPTLVVGAGETGRRAMKHLENHTAFKPVAILDEASAGRSLDGIPVVGGAMEDILDQYGIQAVCIADTRLSPEKRTELRELCDKKELELQDFTGSFSNLGGAVSLTALLELSDGPVTVSVEGEERRFSSGAEALQALTGRWDVVSVGGMNITLRRPKSAGAYEAWMKEYKEATGEEISFF